MPSRSGWAGGGRKRFWVLAYEVGIQDTAGLSLPWLREHYQPLLTFDQGHNGLVLFRQDTSPLQASRTPISPQRPLTTQGQGLELLRYDLPVHECQAGDAVNLGICWTSETPLSVTVEWQRDDDEVRQSLAEEWQAISPAVQRATLRFPVAPGHRGEAPTLWYAGGRWATRRPRPCACPDHWCAPARSRQSTGLSPSRWRPRSLTGYASAAMTSTGR